MYCPKCGSQLENGARFCTNCGAPATAVQNLAPQPAPRLAPQGEVGATPDEVPIRDSGLFPVAYITGMSGSVNGKLHLTSRRLWFKAGSLQGVGGVSVGGMYIPNWDDAQKSKESVSVWLGDVVGVEKKWAGIVVHTGQGDFRFGGMRDTEGWVEAINSARTSLGSRQG